MPGLAAFQSSLGRRRRPRHDNQDEARADQGFHQSARRRCLDPLETPETFAEAKRNNPELKMYRLTYELGPGVREISNDEMQNIRDMAREMAAHPELALPVGDFFPFFYYLEVDLAKCTAMIKMHRRNTNYNRDLLTVKSLFDRTAADENLNEAKTKKFLGKSCYFWKHGIYLGHIERIVRQTDNPSTTAHAYTQKTLGEDASKIQNYIFGVFRAGMRAIAALYGFNTLAGFSEANLENLVGAIFDRDPLMHALATFAHISDAVDFVGIYTDATHPDSQHQQQQRVRWRQTIKYRFVQGCLLVWKYQINIDPAKFDSYSKKAYEKWQEMDFMDTTLAGMLSYLSLEEVPILGSTTLWNRRYPNFFKLQLTAEKNIRTTFAEG